MWGWFAALAALNGWDMLATHLEIGRMGPQAEGSPIMRAAFHVYGFDAVLLLKAGLFILAAVLLAKLGRAPLILRLAVAVYGVLAVAHVWLLLHIGV